MRPGIAIAAVFPAFEAKYSPNQPRVPAGSSEGGQWTSGGGGDGGDIAFDEPDFDLSTLFEFDRDDLLEELPDSSFDLSDIFSFLDEESSDDSGEFTFVVGDGPDVALPDDAAPRIHFVSDTNGNGNDPFPKIPQEWPKDSTERTAILRNLSAGLAATRVLPARYMDLQIRSNGSATIRT